MSPEQLRRRCSPLQRRHKVKKEAPRRSGAPNRAHLDGAPPPTERTWTEQVPPMERAPQTEGTWMKRVPPDGAGPPMEWVPDGAGPRTEHTRGQSGPRR